MPQLGSKFGTWLLERGLTPKYAHMGATKEGAITIGGSSFAIDILSPSGSGGLWEQIDHQSLDPACMCTSLDCHSRLLTDCGLQLLLSKLQS